LGGQNGKNFVTFFGDVFRWHNGHVVIIDFLMFDFVIISLKKIWSHYVTSGHENRRLRGAGGGKPSENLKQHFNWGGGGKPPGSPVYALAHNKHKRTL